VCIPHRPYILLSQKLDQPPRHRSADRRQIIRAVEDNIHRHAVNSEADDLYAEMLDRLDSLYVKDDIGSRTVTIIPISVVILALPRFPGPTRKSAGPHKTPQRSAPMQPNGHQSPLLNGTASPCRNPHTAPSLVGIRSILAIHLFLLIC
jgi:hypothetical protein